MYKLVETQSNAPSYTLMKAGVNENVSLVDVTFDTLRKDGTGGNCIRFYFQDEGGAKFTQTYMEVTSLERLKESAKNLNYNCILKTQEFGYDGKGQSTVKKENLYQFENQILQNCIIEEKVNFKLPKDLN